MRNVKIVVFCLSACGFLAAADDLAEAEKNFATIQKEVEALRHKTAEGARAYDKRIKELDEEIRTINGELAGLERRRGQAILQARQSGLVGTKLDQRLKEIESEISARESVLRHRIDRLERYRLEIVKAAAKEKSAVAPQAAEGPVDTKLIARYEESLGRAVKEDVLLAGRLTYVPPTPQWIVASIDPFRLKVLQARTGLK